MPLDALDKRTAVSVPPYFIRREFLKRNFALVTIHVCRTSPTGNDDLRVLGLVNIGNYRR
jgi:hypothetical protein